MSVRFNAFKSAKIGYGVPRMRGRRISPNEVDSEILKEGYAYWRALCAGRKFPVRADVTPRGLGHLLRNTVLIRVIDGGADYEYRIFGDAHVIAVGQSIQGRRWNELNQAGILHVELRKELYDMVAQSGEPQGMTGLIGSDNPALETVYCETLYLPLGPGGETVDHILGFGVYSPRAL